MTFTNNFRTFCLGLLFSFLSLSTFALDAGVSYAIYSNGEEPYLEVNYEIAGTSIMWTSVDSTSMASSVQVLIMILDGEDVVNYENYILNSPSVLRAESLIDVKRMAISKGQYDLELSFTDLNDTTNVRSIKFPIEVDINKSPYLSEIQLLRSFKMDGTENSFTKNGFFMEPLPFMFYDKNATTLAFYAEIYNTKGLIKDKKYLVRYFIEHETGNGNTSLIAIGSQRRVPSEMDAVLMQMDISKIESGNYSLTVEVRTTMSEKLAEKKIYFQRSNPYLNITANEVSEEALEHQFVQDLTKKEMIYSLRAITPVAPYADAEMIKNILASDDEKKMRFYIFNYFISKHPNDPEAAYKRYMEVAVAVDNTYQSGFGHGFETDRGTTFLRYGKPDDVINVPDEPSAPPYEIWVYYTLNRTMQRNVKFLFYNPSLAGEDYIMLHSTARGEKSNPRWEIDLYKRNAVNEFVGDNYHDATQMQGNNYRVARQYFESF